MKASEIFLIIREMLGLRLSQLSKGLFVANINLTSVGSVDWMSKQKRKDDADDDGKCSTF